jgi:hypothetical protein
MACSFLCCQWHVACFGQVRFQRLQRLQQALPVGVGHASQCLAAGNIAEFTNPLQFGVCCPHEMEKPCAAVGRMWAPFDQAPRLQLVEDATKRDRLDFQKLCESDLIYALVLRGRSGPAIAIGSAQNRARFAQISF